MVDTNTLGLIFIAMGVLLFLLEATMPGFFIAVPGTTLLVLGLFAMVAPGWAVFSQWAPLVVVIVGVPSTLGTIYFYRKMAPPGTSPTTTSADQLVGHQGLVTTRVEPDTTRGKVKVSSQTWSATATQPIEEGERVRIRNVEGITLWVEPVDAEPTHPKE